MGSSPDRRGTEAGLASIIASSDGAPTRFLPSSVDRRGARGRRGMDAIGDMRALLGLGLHGDELGALQMGLRAAVVYVVTVAIVRLGKKRFMGRATAFDV